MKTAIKILTALAAVAGAVYVIATYGDQIVAWAKKIMASLPKCPCCQKDDEAVVEEAVEEVPTEDAEEAEEPAVEVTIEVAAEPVAEEADFEA